MQRQVKFPFYDLSSFRDFIVFAQTYLPDNFHPREGARPDEQWTLDLAFEGLRTGLTQERARRPKVQALIEAEALVEEAYAHYLGGRDGEGFRKLEQLQSLLKRAV